MLNGVGDERIHRRHCFYMAGRREWRNSAAGRGGGAPWSRGLRPTRCEFAPHTRESLISPLRGANFSPGKAPGGCVGLRLTPGKALFFRRGAQTFCREEPSAAVWVCASFPGKPYSSVEGRKLFAGKSRRRLGEFAPHTRESRILPLRGANQLPGKGACGCEGLRLGAGSLRLIPGKPYSSVEGRKLPRPPAPFPGNWFAPHTPESLILPSRGANLSPAARSPSGTRT